MKLPRDLSGHDLVAALCRQWGYIKVNQVGSHIILQTQVPTPHRVAIPAHNALRIGTLKAFFEPLPITKVLIGKRFLILCKNGDEFSLLSPIGNRISCAVADHQFCRQVGDLIVCFVLAAGVGRVGGDADGE